MTVLFVVPRQLFSNAEDSPPIEAYQISNLVVDMEDLRDNHCDNWIGLVALNVAPSMKNIRQ